MSSVNFNDDACVVIVWGFSILLASVVQLASISRNFTYFFARPQTIERTNPYILRQRDPAQNISNSIIWGIRPADYRDDELAILIKMLSPAGIYLQGTYTSQSLADQTTRLKKISPKRLLIAVDQEGGDVRHLIDDPNPGAPTLRAKSSSEQCTIIRDTDRMLQEAGVDINFGLIGDTATHPSDVMAKRSYSFDPSEVAGYVDRYLSCATQIRQTIKHFPGAGGTDIDSHDTIPIFGTSLHVWSETVALPFLAAIHRNVSLIMLGHLIYPALDDAPASLSPKWVTAIRSTGYEGKLITDDLGMLSTDPEMIAASAEKAFHAGADYILISSLPGYAIVPTYEAIKRKESITK